MRRNVDLRAVTVAAVGVAFVMVLSGGISSLSAEGPRGAGEMSTPSSPTGPGIPLSVGHSATGAAVASAGADPNQGPHPGTLAVFEAGYPDSVDPQVDYDTVGVGTLQNVYQTLVSYEGNSTDTFVPTLATCVPGTTQCSTDYGNPLVVNGSGPLAHEPEYWTFVLDPAARFYDPQTGASWGVYPSDVMFSIARDLLWSDPLGLTPGWIVAQALLPSGTTSWDGGLHFPYNNTPSNILGSMLVNDSRYCPMSDGAFAGHGCITFVADGGGSGWPILLELLADPDGAGIDPCGWFTYESAGLPGWTGTTAPQGDGSCRLPNGGTTTNSSSWSTYLSGLSPTAWDTLEQLIVGNPAPQPAVRFALVGSGPYFDVRINQTAGYLLEANPAYAAPSGCWGVDGLAAYPTGCDPLPGTYIDNVSVSWEPSGGNLSEGLNAAENGTSDFAAISANDTPGWVSLESAGKASIAEVPSESIFDLNFNLNWSASAYEQAGFPGFPTIPEDFFSGMAARGLFTEAYPYAAVQNTIWTNDSVQFMVPSGGPIPRHMPPYSASIYPPAGNVSFPNGTPDLFNSSIVGSAAWWWAEGTASEGPYYDPELADCSSDSPCGLPIVGLQGDPMLDAAIANYVVDINEVTGGAIQPYTFNLSIISLVRNLSAGPTDMALPDYSFGWAPDYPDPTDYLLPYAAPSGVYSYPDALNATLTLPQYDESACGHTAPTFADLSYWAKAAPLNSSCQGVAYQVALAWMATAAPLPPSSARTLDYNLISHVLNKLALYVWYGQQNVVVGVAPWINLTSINSNPVQGGSGDQYWFQLRYLSGPPIGVPSSTPVGASPGTPMYDPLNGEIYVPNAGSNTVSVVSGSTHLVLTNISVGSEPETPALDSATGQVFVSNFGSANVTVINGTSNLVNTTLAVGNGPCPPVFDAQFDQLFIANNGSNSVSVINGLTDGVVATITVQGGPATPALDLANEEVYVPDYASDNVSVINSSTLFLVKNISVGEGPEPPVYDPANGDIYVPNSGSGTVSVIQGSTNTVVATVPVGTTPFLPRPSLGPALFSRTTLPRGRPLFDPVNGDVYVVNSGSTNVSVISGSTNHVVSTIPVGSDPQSPVYDPATSNIYVANMGSGNMSVVSASTNQLVATVSTGAQPAPPVFDNASGQVYVPETGASSVLAIVSSYYITFRATGLPTGASWQVAIGKVSGLTGSLFSRTTVPFAEKNGTVPYVIAGPSGYRVAGGFAPAGQLTVAGADLAEPIEFVRGTTYAVTFHEAGLPKGAAWCATVGWQECGTGGTLAFANLTPSAYPFAVAPVPGFHMTGVPGKSKYTPPPTGVVNLTRSVSVKVKFVAVLYALTFAESGVPAGKAWTVRLQYTTYGKTVTKHGRSKQTSMVFEVPNGTVEFTVGGVKGYVGHGSGNVTIDGSPLAAQVNFTKASGLSPAAPRGVRDGGSGGTELLVARDRV